MKLVAVMWSLLGFERRILGVRCDHPTNWATSHCHHTDTFLFIICLHNNTTKNTQDTVAKKPPLGHLRKIFKKWGKNISSCHSSAAQKNNSKMHPSKKMKKKSCHLFRPRHLSHYFLIDSFSGEFQLQWANKVTSARFLKPTTPKASPRQGKCKIL